MHTPGSAFRRKRSGTSDTNTQESTNGACLLKESRSPDPNFDRLATRPFMMQGVTHESSTTSDNIRASPYVQKGPSLRDGLASTSTHAALPQSLSTPAGIQMTPLPHKSSDRPKLA
ncbi:hypothetical protein BDP55DRAFT_429198 [Colletotrichum godetiae]|uniref:Uncharacterized protein n=1 Tax=Colletotrichum godetiae TaxID=1209918 RepID=A0AAJ0ARL5_9PEZI|nr:uncharacterized protein BDP55DRAFT_429198 [Colletotrichum godetiae]KAK1689103.1 hypothetical protein BDP55DRAFT_429198 [Colletotrichum godetiae]